MMTPAGNRARSNAAVLCVWVVLTSCGGGAVDHVPGVAGDLLAGARPTASQGARHVERWTNGIMANEGDFWRTEVTGTLDAGGFALYDLGEVKTIRCALVQGDNNDAYELKISEDGQNFQPLWTGPPMGRPGMQLRHQNGLDGRGRYLRLTAYGGDGFYSVGELAVFSECPAEWPPRFVSREGTPADQAARWKLVLFGFATVLFLILNRRGSRPWMPALVLLPVALGLSVTRELADLWPLDENEQTFVRAVVAAIAATIFLREYFSPGRYPVHPRATAGALALLAVVAVGCYYHFGMPQFRDNAKGRQTLVHPWDMRVYFPVAKYFKELRFDGLYLASVAAHLDNHPGLDPESVGGVRLRDLRNNQMRTGREVMSEIQSVRERFSPERWELFKKDMKYFEDVMGAGDYLGSLQDHGGNATPVWLLAAHVLFRNAPASELTLTLTAIIDPLLLALLFFVVARTYGVRVMLLLVIVWGTTDFSRFGTNLMGSTLRADWMVSLGLGACALKRRRWALGGGLIAYGGLIRAFPALAAAFLAVPALWWIVDRYRESKRIPGLGELRSTHRPTLRALTGVIGTVAALVLASSLVFSFSGSWGAWLEKISIHAEKPNSNHVGLRNVVAFSPELIARKVVDERRLEPWTAWQDLQRQTFASRKPLFYLGILLYLGVAVVACRRVRLDQAAMIGLTMIPVFFYPANYYCHYVFLLPLLATRGGAPRPLFEPEGRTELARVGGIVLLMGVVQLPTLAEWPDVTYTYQSIIMLVAFALILVPMARAAWFGPPATVAIADDEADGRPAPATAVGEASGASVA